LQEQYGGAQGGLCWLYSSSTQARLFLNNVLVAVIPHRCIGLVSNNGELLTLTQFGASKDTGGALISTWRGLQCVDPQLGALCSVQVSNLYFPNPDFPAAA